MKGFFFAAKFRAIILTTATMALLLQACNNPEVHKQPIVQQKQVAVKPPSAPPPAIPARHDTLCIAAVGDIMLGTSYPDSSTLPPDSAVNSFNAVKPQLKNSDVIFGNLEGTLLDQGEPAHYKLHQKSKAFLFRMPTRYAGVLKNAGFNVLSLANNHISDFDVKGRKSTMKTLDSLGINYAGLLDKPSTVFELNGVKYGFCSFAPNANTVPLLDLKGATRIISDLKQRCDVLIVSYHGGGEGVNFEHVPFQMESFISEKRGDVHAFAHNAIDAGADLIFGNGPHVNRAMEIYNGRLIAYSLGNFCTYRCVSVAGVCGLAPLLKVYVNKKGQFLHGRLISFRQDHNLGLLRDTLNRAAMRIRTLTDTDFPGGNLDIDDDGEITATLPDSLGLAKGQQ
ncbi:CapA family protein [Mucilaginibacter dorajii]|uniref:Capsule synthesis protein CapA domain-containing protein n=1 Tax=Mucilaginibacter dorajii TaxID=692994 RepID=A0ABP7Q926_9SPHI|nr:CapA family protein [Mucilaginibacter dorajii]MCS3737082.1 poly-gamma-glutamate capsule biosynthesis protein CapA/YwtB (metallophosphatase superfamily) [Mucilaginibacter dorajii]